MDNTYRQSLADVVIYDLLLPNGPGRTVTRSDLSLGRLMMGLGVSG
jgi:hypothetical protein